MKVIQAAINLQQARINEQKWNERVEKIKARIFAERDYINQHKGGKVTTADRLYLVPDADADHFFQRYDDELKAEGIHPRGGFGYCPACIAQTKRIDAESDLLQAGDQLVPGISKAAVSPEHRDKAIRLIMSMVRMTKPAA